MILARFVFQAKFGKAEELATILRNTNDAVTRSLGMGQGWRGLSGRGWRVLTDLSGPFDTVVLELELESLADWERRRGEIFANPVFQDSFVRIAEMVDSGRSEFYTVVGQG